MKWSVSLAKLANITHRDERIVFFSTLFNYPDMHLSIHYFYCHRIASDERRRISSRVVTAADHASEWGAPLLSLPSFRRSSVSLLRLLPRLTRSGFPPLYPSVRHYGPFEGKLHLQLVAAVAVEKVSEGGDDPRSQWKEDKND